MQENSIEGYRLSPQQRRLWRLQARDRAGLYQARSAVLLEGTLRPELLRAAVGEVVSSHEILRTNINFAPAVSMPLQIIGPARFEWFEEQGFQEEGSEERQGETAALAKEAGRPSLDVAHGPVLRASLFALAASRHLLVMTLPALHADLLTLQKLNAEIFKAYAAALDGEAYATEVMQYVDLSEWQNELLESEENGRAAKDFWRRQSAQAASSLRLPGEKGEAERGVYEPASQTTKIDAAVTGRLRELARSRGWSVEALLLSCWQVLLWRVAGEAEFAVGTAFDGRRFAEVDDVLGLCARALPVRARLRRGLGFADLVGEVERSLKEARERQDEFSEDDWPEGQETGASRIGFEHVRWPEASQVAGLSVAFRHLSSHFDRFKLKLSCSEREEAVVADFHYDAAAFEAGAVERLARHLHALVASAVDDDGRAVGSLEILDEDERRHLLVEFNETATERAVRVCFHEAFERQAERTPEAVAVVDEDERLSYGELNARANQLAHHLRTQGVGPEVVVGLCLERSIEMLVAILGILKAGGAYLPLDSSYPAERISFMVKDARVKLVVTRHALAARFGEQAAQLLMIDEDRKLINRDSRENPAVKVAAENLAYVIYTSGSTGQPKGVAIEHGGLMNYLNWCASAYRVGEGEGSPVHSSVAFDLTVTSLFSPLMAGKKVVLLGESEAAGELLYDALKKRENFSLVKLTPAHLQLLNLLMKPAEAAGAARALVVGGEALHAEEISFWRTHAPETRIINEYGPTETVVGCCVYEAGADVQAGRPVPIGRPIANTQIFILDEEMNPVPILVAGEIYIGGEGVARGYLNRPGSTAEKFVPNPFGPRAGQRLYRSGDVGRYRPDGNIEFLGRADYQVKVKGYRIELGEIEAALCEHGRVREAVVTLREEKNEKSLVGYVVAREGATLREEELRSHLEKRLPPYMLPSSFVVLERMPLTANGKVDRHALPPPGKATRETAGYVAPRNRTEELLAGIWAEILNVPRVGINDNFFRLGGDSIRGIQAIARANRAGIQLTAHQLFQHQTIAQLAAVAGSAPVVQVTQETVTGPVPLTPIQRWFFEADLPEPHHFNQSVLLEARRSLTFSVLEKAVGLLLAHHDALRLRFERSADGWQQFHAPAGEPAPLSEVRLAALNEADYEAELAAVVAERQSSLNLTRGPLLRFTLLRSEGGRADLLHVVIHHLVVDGVSWRILLEDLERSYDRLSRGESAELPPKTTSYKYWAERLADYAQSDALRQEADYWLSELGASSAALPLDAARGSNGNDGNTLASARTHSVSLDAEETRSLLQDVPLSLHVQINDVLLTALARAFARWTGAHSLLIHLESHGRQDIFADVDLLRTVGWFTALIPVRLSLPPSARPGDELKAVKEQLRRLPHHGVGYGLLRYMSDRAEIVERLKTLPQAEVLFNYFGNLDQVLPASSQFRIYRETAEHDRSSRGARRYLLEVNAHVMRGQLTVEWTYSANFHRRETIEELASQFVAALRLLCDYSRNAETTAYTISDFPKAKLNQTELDQVLSKFLAPRGESA